MGITYPKDQKENAIRRGMALFAFGVDDRHLKSAGIGGVEFIGPMDRVQAQAMFAFVVGLRMGKSARVAFDEAGFPET